MKKVFSLVLALILICGMSVTSSAAEFVTISESSNAVVTEVVDGDAIQVKLSNGSLALVKMIGVNTNGSTEAYNFLNTELMGATVYLVPDSNVKSPVDRWNYMYIYKGNKFLNAIVLTSGFGQINPDHKNATLYDSLTRNQSTAKSNKLGVWNDGYGAGVYTYSGERININTASREQLRTMLKSVNYSLADNIIVLRESNPFQTVSDVKFAKGMTKEIYDLNKQKMSVVTNVRTAGEAELRTLKNLTDTDVASFTTYRTKFGISNIEDAFKYATIVKAKFNDNKNFMTLENIEDISYTINAVTVNINTASYAQLIGAGANDYTANQIIRQRNSFALKSLYDLSQLSGVNFSAATINSFADNLHVYTEINKATEAEISSLFGENGVSTEVKNIIANRPYSDASQIKYYIPLEKYNKIAPYIYVGEVSTDYININTATYSQLISAGYIVAQAETIVTKSRKMKAPVDMTIDLGAMTTKSSLYTNINTASMKELMSLSENMTTTMATRILEYRYDQPFGSQEEIELLFTSMDRYGIYGLFKEFLVVR